MRAAAVVHREARHEATPWLAALHTPEEDRWYFEQRVLPACRLWGALDQAELVGIIAFRDDWIDHLYILPKAQGRGIGTELLTLAQSSFDRLHLWTFQRNRQARLFYEARGFALARETDGARNEENEPDSLYVWQR